MNWYAIMNIVMWIIGKVMADDNNNGKPDLFEKGSENELPSTNVKEVIKKGLPEESGKSQS